MSNMEMTPKTVCLRCGGSMLSKGVEKIQLGQTGFFLGTWSNLMAGSMEVEVFVCSRCGKIELYDTNNAHFEEQSDDFIGDELPTDAEGTPQRNCPNCGGTHDFDYPKCPYCKHSYSIAR